MSKGRQLVLHFLSLNYIKLQQLEKQSKAAVGFKPSLHKICKLWSLYEKLHFLSEDLVKHLAAKIIFLQIQGLPQLQEV